MFGVVFVCCVCRVCVVWFVFMGLWCGVCVFVCGGYLYVGVWFCVFVVGMCECGGCVFLCV